MKGKVRLQRWWWLWRSAVCNDTAWYGTAWHWIFVVCKRTRLISHASWLRLKCVKYWCLLCCGNTNSPCFLQFSLRHTLKSERAIVGFIMQSKQPPQLNDREKWWQWKVGVNFIKYFIFRLCEFLTFSQIISVKYRQNKLERHLYLTHVHIFLSLLFEFFVLFRGGSEFVIFRHFLWLSNTHFTFAGFPVPHGHHLFLAFHSFVHSRGLLSPFFCGCRLVGVNQWVCRAVRVVVVVSVFKNSKQFLDYCLGWCGGMVSLEKWHNCWVKLRSSPELTTTAQSRVQPNVFTQPTIAQMMMMTIVMEIM